MPWFPPAVAPQALAAANGGGRIKKQRAGLPKLLHRLFIKVLRLRPPPDEDYYGGCRMGGGAGDDEEYCYCYSYDVGSGSSSWAAGVLSSIPEEDYDDDDDGSSEEEGTPDVVAPTAVLRKAKSERFVVGPPDAAATVVHVEILL